MAKLLDKSSKAKSLPGATAFLLHDTYGFPIELTEEITKDRGFVVDVEGFRVAMAEQQKRAKDARGEMTANDTGTLVQLVENTARPDSPAVKRLRRLRRSSI